MLLLGSVEVKGYEPPAIGGHAGPGMAAVAVIAVLRVGGIAGDRPWMPLYAFNQVFTKANLKSAIAPMAGLAHLNSVWSCKFFEDNTCAVRVACG
jgi:hypothetical protein